MINTTELATCGLHVVSATAKPLHDGGQIVIKFANGRGASIIRDEHSYGSVEGLFELAVLDNQGHIDYTTPVASDVEGWLTKEEVFILLQQIDVLPSILPALEQSTNTTHD